MKSIRRKAAGAATAGALALSLTGLAGTAQADPADDVATMAGNVPAAVEKLVAQIELALDRFQSGENEGYPLTYLTLDLSDAPGMAVSQLVAGTTQFGQLGLGVSLVVGGLIGGVTPYTIAFDEDPASVVDVFDPNNFAIIVGNVPEELANAQDHVVEALIAGLEGNLSEDGYLPGVGTPALVGSALEAVGALLNVVEGTNPDLDYTVGTGAMLALHLPFAATATYVQEAEAQLAPVFDALAPVTDPIIEALGG